MVVIKIDYSDFFFLPQLPTNEATIWLSAALRDIRYHSSLEFIPLPNKDHPSPLMGDLLVMGKEK